MSEEETLDALDANFGPSPMRARLRALLAENERLRAEMKQTHLALAVIVQKAGGEVAVTMSDMVAVHPRAQVVTYTDPASLRPELRIRVEQP